MPPWGIPLRDNRFCPFRRASSVFMPPWGIPLRDCSIVETAAKTAASSCRLGAFLSGTQHPTLPTGNRKGLHAALGHSSPGQEETQTGDRAGSVFMPPWGIPLRDHRDVSGPGEGPGVFMPPWGIPLRDFHRVVESLLAPPVFMPPWGIPLRDPVQARTEGKSHVFMPPWGIPLRDPTAEIIAGLAVSSCRLGAFLSGTQGASAVWRGWVFMPPWGIPLRDSSAGKPCLSRAPRALPPGEEKSWFLGGCQASSRRTRAHSTPLLSMHCSRRRVTLLFERHLAELTL